VSASASAAVALSVLTVAVAVWFGVVASALSRQLRRIARLADDLEHELGRAGRDLAEGAAAVSTDAAALDALTERAEELVGVLEQSTQLGYLAVAQPVIKAAALASGVRHGARRLLGGADADGGDPPSPGAAREVGGGAREAGREAREAGRDRKARRGPSDGSARKDGRR